MATVSIKEVARIAETSKSTVSRYINDPNGVKRRTGERIQAAINQTGYTPNALARNFRRGQTRKILVCMPTVGYSLFADAMKGVARVAKEKNYSVLIRETQFEALSIKTLSDMINAKEVDGILFFTGVIPYGDDIFPTLGGKPLPIVAGFEHVNAEQQHFQSVHIDNTAATKQGTDYLISLGHKRIAFISSSTEYHFTMERESGYRKAMNNAGLCIDEKWIARESISLDGARIGTRKLLNLSKPPTAIFCACGDVMAMGAIHEIKSTGLKIPDDISVVGFDDIHYAEIMDPPLTTIAQPAEEIGEKSMYKLCKAIEGSKSDVDPVIVPHQLVIRESTAPPGI